jgi:hypothetical protein
MAVKPQDASQHSLYRELCRALGKMNVGLGLGPGAGASFRHRDEAT